MAKVAAAEVVAALNGNASNDLPDFVSDWVAGKPKPDAKLNATACSALDVILAKSELKEWWEENKEVYPKWVAWLECIKTRISDAG